MTVRFLKIQIFLKKIQIFFIFFMFNIILCWKHIYTSSKITKKMGKTPKFNLKFIKSTITYVCMYMYYSPSFFYLKLSEVVDFQWFWNWTCWIFIVNHRYKSIELLEIFRYYIFPCVFEHIFDFLVQSWYIFSKSDENNIIQSELLVIVS